MPDQLVVATDIQARLEMPGVEALARGRPAEGNHVPVEQPRIAFQLDDRAQLGLRC